MYDLPEKKVPLRKTRGFCRCERDKITRLKRLKGGVKRDQFESMYDPIKSQMYCYKDLTGNICKNKSASGDYSLFALKAKRKNLKSVLKYLNLKKKTKDLSGNEMVALREISQELKLYPDEEEIRLMEQYGDIGYPETMSNIPKLKHNDKAAILESLNSYGCGEETEFGRIISESQSLNEGLNKAEKILLPFFKRLFYNYDFCIRFGENTLNEILSSIKHNKYEEARFKTSVETGYRGKKYNRWRVELEKECFDYEDAANLDVSKFEKYGYLSSWDNNTDEDHVSDYGNLKGLLSKSILFHRTSFTLGDSLNNKGHSHASMVDNPSISSIPGVIEGDYSCLNTLLKLIQNHSLNDLAPMSICKNLNSKYKIRYFELQFHGPLPWAYIKDVINENGKKMSEMPDFVRPIYTIPSDAVIPEITLGPKESTPKDFVFPSDGGSGGVFDVFDDGGSDIF